MATLERIRQRSGLLIMVIGLAMLAFILTDLFSSGDSLLRGDATVVGEIEGKKIEYRDFITDVDERMGMLQRTNPDQMRNVTRINVAEQIWDEKLREEILGERYEELGITVTNKELARRLRNNEEIRSQPNFQDPNTGQFSMARFRDYIANLTDQARTDEEARKVYTQWINFEEGVYDQTLSEKYQAAVRKGLFVPERLAKAMYNRNESSNVVQYFGLEFNTIDDSEVEYSDSDLKNYYNENNHEFKRERRRDIAFVNFRVEPSAEDSAATRKELNNYLKPEVIKSRGKQDTLPSFYNAPNDSLFAVARSDARVAAKYQTMNELNPMLDSVLADKDSNYIHGPYQESGQLVLTKISDISSMPDSVRARHILISYEGAGGGRQQRSLSDRPPREAQALADSLFRVLKEDTAGFAAQAQDLSDDPGSGAKGGDLGWFSKTEMVQPFSNFAFLNKTGDVGLVQSQFGFHIINILDQEGSNKALKLVHIRRNIEPSETTRDSIYELANRFASKAKGSGDFASAAEEMGYNARPVTDLEPMQENILGLGSNRKLVKWAFEEESKVGELDLFNHNNNAYVVATLTGKSSDGLGKFENVREEIIPLVVKEKKAEILKKQIEDAQPDQKDLTKWATSLGVEVKTQGVRLGESTLGEFGSEPKVIGAFAGLEVNEISGVISGDRGVYVGRATSKVPGDELPNYSSEVVRYENEMSNLVGSDLFKSLKENANVKDNRWKFF